MQAEIPISQIVESPNLKKVLLSKTRKIVSESEVLVKGKVKVKASGVKKVTR